jgi:hypothetical protein
MGLHQGLVERCLNNHNVVTVREARKTMTHPLSDEEVMHGIKVTACNDDDGFNCWKHIPWNYCVAYHSCYGDECTFVRDGFSKPLPT